MFQKRRIFELQRYEWSRGWKKLHSDELHKLYPSPNVIRITKTERKRRAGHVACMRDKKFAYMQSFGGNPEVKRLLGSSRCRWEYNNKMELKEIGWSCMDWINRVQDRDQWRALVST
jgi:hypothetical protein